ncbi:hypothetical protein [Paraburkholderia phenoliruptrix]|uniref:hypothetical protein n=1 Tax=Paraburkholderia phenoliruptrix TaxID=252970 RepID=UPI003D976091
MKVRVSKWLLLCIACALLLRAFASWGWWEQGPIWWYPVAVAVFAWLGLGGTLLLSRIRGWRSYVSTIMYMEAMEDGLCSDRPFTWEGRNRWYREHGSPWRLQPVPESMRIRRSFDANDRSEITQHHFLLGILILG